MPSTSPVRTPPATKGAARAVAAPAAPALGVCTLKGQSGAGMLNTWSILRAGNECGWVGFLASGESPRQRAQSKTIHCNLYGVACTFAAPGWAPRMADYMDEHRALVTRCDLALDFFDGISGGMDRVASDYDAGAMDHYGHRPDHNCVGAWRAGGVGRSFYFGSKAAGKQTNVYDKGVQLYGKQDATGWQRIELRYGNQKRLLPTDILRRPADFFSGGHFGCSFAP
ncbi:replication initiation factor domain-containing protein [Acidovorax sp.]|uniref:replication initiation factor domain-containing protein n=1 Tax=Acidovorax sp. TaxID=1872122 RepID=UPI0025C19F75|nr:replication initiation factor domain-containing protein [Acidovorax sp.]MBL7088569.1 replication initiation factor domain-containing protein [Acidovorax sp.]